MSDGDDKKISLWRKTGQSTGAIPDVGTASGGDYIEGKILDWSHNGMGDSKIVAGVKRGENPSLALVNLGSKVAGAKDDGSSFWITGSSQISSVVSGVVFAAAVAKVEDNNNYFAHCYRTTSSTPSSPRHFLHLVTALSTPAATNNIVTPPSSSPPPNIIISRHPTPPRLPSPSANTAIIIILISMTPPSPSPTPQRVRLMFSVTTRRSCLHQIPQSRTRPFHLRMYRSWDEDECEPMFIQLHDPDYVPELMYPEYIPLEDEHVLLAEEQLLPLVVSPTAESPGYVVESDPEKDPEEYEDDESEDGPFDYPMDGGDNGDDDDDDPSGDDANEVDEDGEDEEEEEEHLASADFAVVVPTVEPVSPPEGIEHVIPPPSTDITTTRARITVRLQAFISLPPEAEVERLLAMPTPPPSPLTSLSPPSAGECLASYCRITITSTTTTLYIPPPVDRKDDIPETELPPRKKSCLFALGPMYEVRKSSTARPTEGRGIDYGFISNLDAEARRRGIREVGYGIRDTWVDPTESVPKIAPMTLREVNTRVTELAELHENDTHDLYALLEDAQDSRTRISQRVTMDSQQVDFLMEDRMAHQETILIVEEEAYAS
uniref:Uncharacterized protein n=1 Tax=Tanacetum cinerariifolium TaxID=118510 RepID=A0A6L2M4D3_TANCI|nr:hypothetical protein [Tanacetum cinerariifolium]